MHFLYVGKASIFENDKCIRQIFTLNDSKEASHISALT